MDKPIVSVFIRKSLISALLEQRDLPRLLALEHASAQTKQTLYFFSLDDVNLKNKSIRGTYYNRDKGLWRRKEFPFPHIIYKRSASTKKEQPLMENLERTLAEQGVKWLNFPHSFNKWEVYGHLADCPSFSHYLPETKLFTDSADLKLMLEKHRSVYLKACYGGRGRQVICVVKLANDKYKYSYFINKLHVKKEKSFHGLLSGILKFYGSNPFIVQEAIDLITFENSIVDLRAEVQRDGRGEISIVAIPVRVSKNNAPITTHASSYTFDSFFTKKMKYNQREFEGLKEKVADFIHAAYPCIESAYGQSGEVGIDIGLDKKGRLWFIECNSRSLKVSLYKAYNEELINQSYLNLFKYANYLYYAE